MEMIFAVISDVHIKSYKSKDEEKLDLAFRRLKDYKEKLDGIIITGDITNSGSKKEYKKFNNIYSQYSNCLGEKMFLMGNHDCWGGLSTKIAQKRFEKSMNETIHSHKIIKGYHFIAISTEGKSLNGVFNRKLLNWLKNQLEEATKDDDKKPIFLGVHQHIKDTVYGSKGWGTEKLYNILKDFPQVITFSGHSHYPLNDERTIHQKDFTSVGAGSTSYMELEKGKMNGTVPSKANKVSQGLIVKVCENNVVKISTIDFTKNYINEDRWIIREPSNKMSFKYLDERRNFRVKPSFKAGSLIDVKHITSNSVKINFTQAFHEDFIHSYEVQVINKSSGKSFKKLVFSDFYMEYVKARLSFRIKGLYPNTEYTMVIRAIESFGNKSDNYLTTNFKTLGLSVSNFINDRICSAFDLKERSIDFE